MEDIRFAFDDFGGIPLQKIIMSHEKGPFQKEAGLPTIIFHSGKLT